MHFDGIAKILTENLIIGRLISDENNHQFQPQFKQSHILRGSLPVHTPLCHQTISTPTDYSPSRMILVESDLGLSCPHDPGPWWSPPPLPLLPAGINPPIAVACKRLAPQIEVFTSKPCLIQPSVREQLTSQDSLSTRLIRNPEEKQIYKRNALIRLVLLKAG